MIFLYLMSFYVSLHIAALRKLFSTIMAIKRFFSSVSSDVYLQCAWPHKWGLANRAFKRSVSRMPPHMICQMALSCECFLTVWELTNERFFPWMNSQMCFEVPLFGKGLCTSLIWTFERFLACLWKKIIFEIVKLTWVLMWMLSLFFLEYIL